MNGECLDRCLHGIGVKGTRVEIVVAEALSDGETGEDEGRSNKYGGETHDEWRCVVMSARREGKKDEKFSCHTGS